MSTMADRRFQLLKWGGKDDGADVLGGAVSGENVYIRTYGCPYRDGVDKEACDLEVGQSTIYFYRLSGTTGTYKIVRIK